MLRLKQKKQEEAAAAAAAAAAAEAAPATGGTGGDDAGASSSSSSAAADGTKKISLLGGDEGRKATGGVRKKMKPGEIRVQKDIAELDAGKVGAVTFPDPADLTSMVLTVRPDQGLWAGGTFSFTIRVPDMYPHEPPKVMCVTPIYHPNIDTAGHVCLNILRDDWKPVLDINAVIYGLIFLLYEPNPNDPLNHEAAALFRDNKDAFVRNVNSSLRGGRVGAITYPRQL